MSDRQQQRDHLDQRLTQHWDAIKQHDQTLTAQSSILAQHHDILLEHTVRLQTLAAVVDDQIRDHQARENRLLTLEAWRESFGAWTFGQRLRWLMQGRG